MNPADLPDVGDAGAQHGLLHTILVLAVYALTIAGAVGYLVWKLPRPKDGPSLRDESDEASRRTQSN